MCQTLLSTVDTKPKIGPHGEWGMMNIDNPSTLRDKSRRIYAKNAKRTVVDINIGTM